MNVIINFVSSYLSPELINEVELPDDLLDARTDEEIKDRYFYLYHSIYGKLAVIIAMTLKKTTLTTSELGFISERLEAYLKEQGF